MRILVTGGAGYIGSHAVKELVERGHAVAVLDDLSNGHLEAVNPKALFIRGNTSDSALLTEIFHSQKIEGVMHFAANIEVAESVLNPEKYYENNFVNTLGLLRAMKRAGVNKVIFSSTAAVYGNPLQIPIEEDQPRNPINPYGRSKMMIEMVIEDYLAAYGLGYTILRYFNVAGASPDGEIGEDHFPESHLIPKLLASAAGGYPRASIFGTDYPTPDGTCIRDYVHVVDLALAHALAIENVAEGEGRVYNLGSENGFSVHAVIHACERVTGMKFAVRNEARRPGDPAVLVASSKKIRADLGWLKMYPDLDSIVAHAWKWHSLHPGGYSRAMNLASSAASPLQ